MIEEVPLKKQIIVEEPILEINIKVDQTINGEYQGRLNWGHMNSLDLVELLQTPTELSDSPHQTIVPIELAEKRAKKIKARIKSYILEKSDPIDVKNFSWKEWEEYPQ